jgi:hypothetical protein
MIVVTLLAGAGKSDFGRATICRGHPVVTGRIARGKSHKLGLPRFKGRHRGSLICLLHTDAPAIRLSDLVLLACLLQRFFAVLCLDGSEPCQLLAKNVDVPTDRFLARASSWAWQARLPQKVGFAGGSNQSLAQSCNRTLAFVHG